MCIYMYIHICKYHMFICIIIICDVCICLNMYIVFLRHAFSDRDTKESCHHYGPVMSHAIDSYQIQTSHITCNNGALWQNHHSSLTYRLNSVDYQWSQVWKSRLQDDFPVSSSS